MKIAFLSPFYPYRGGIAQFSDSLFLALKKEHDVKAFSFTRQYPRIFFPGTTQYVSESDINRNVKAEHILDSINPVTYGRTANSIIKYNPDMVLLSYWIPFFAPSMGWVARKLQKKGITVISILHNVVPHEKRIGDDVLTKFFMNQSSGFVLLNHDSENDLLGVKPDAKYIINTHPLYDHYGEIIPVEEARKELDIPSDKKVILFFGFIRDYKGLDLLIESMKNLDDSYLLVIAGEVYGDFKKYRDIIDKNNLKSRIKLFIRYIPENEIVSFFSAADVCVLPYRTATQSGIAGISYHFNLPVIVTDTGGLSEMVEDNKTGLIIEKPEPGLISAAIKEYFENDSKQKFLPYIKEYKEKHSWDKLADEIISLYKSLK
jgi:glycosyltransferase involved in cell wall biosynthesis